MGNNNARFAMFGDVQGAYAFNNFAYLCGQGSPCNCFCGCKPMWFEGGTGCCAGCDDGQKFIPGSADWGSRDCALRAQFEQELLGPEMQRALAEAPKVCECCMGGCPNMGQQAAHLNDGWCKRVNEQLLNPRGYSCHAHHWVTVSHSDDGGDSSTDHMALIVVKGEMTAPMQVNLAGIQMMAAMAQNPQMMAQQQAMMAQMAAGGGGAAQQQAMMAQMAQQQAMVAGGAGAGGNAQQAMLIQQQQAVIASQQAMLAQQGAAAAALPVAPVVQQMQQPGAVNQQKNAGGLPAAAVVPV